MELRRRNFIAHRSPHKTVTDETYDVAILTRADRLVQEADLAGFETRRAKDAVRTLPGAGLVTSKVRGDPSETADVEFWRTAG